MSCSTRIRFAEASDYSGIARVHVQSWKSTYRGLISQDYLDRLTPADREPNWKRLLEDKSRIVIVSECSDSEIIGFVSGFPNRRGEYAREYVAELGAIYILQNYRRLGIGRDLVKSLVHEFLNRNYDSMIVWVLESNPYSRFYERLGGERIGSDRTQIGSETYEIVAYGWRDLRSASIEISGSESKTALNLPRSVSCRSPSSSNTS